MNTRPDMNAHFNEKRRQYAKKNRRMKKLLIALLCITIAAIWTLIGFIAYQLSKSVAPEEPVVNIVTTENITTTDIPYSEAIIETQGPKLVSVTLDRAQIHRGSLILVSGLLGYEYSFEKEPELITLYGNKSNSYKISSTALKLNRETFNALEDMFRDYKNETGNRDYQITHAYRTYDEQSSIYESYIDTYGAEQGALLAAQAGYSEHHSGYAFDMNVFTSGGVSFSLGSAKDENPIYGWIYEHCKEYGFVLRYPEGKTSLTGITNEPWHFRYVGKGHSAYMSENNLVLEEYIALIRQHVFGRKQLEFAVDGVNYSVSYIPFDQNEESKTLELPVDTEYTLSGDNGEGIIITIIK